MGWEGYNDRIQYWRKGLELARTTGWEGYNDMIQYWRKGLELARTTGWEGYNDMIQYWRKGLELARTTGWEGYNDNRHDSHQPSVQTFTDLAVKALEQVSLQQRRPAWVHLHALVQISP